MKSLLLFAFWGVSCCMAVSVCSKNELQKCSTSSISDETAEERLNRNCRETECRLDIFDRCGISYFDDMGPVPIKGERQIFNTLCVKTHPLRRKYLDNIKCIEKETWGSKNLVKDCGIQFKPKEEFCKEISSGMKCAADYVAEKCGQDAREAFLVGSYPSLDPYDCLQEYF